MRYPERAKALLRLETLLRGFQRNFKVMNVDRGAALLLILEQNDPDLPQELVFKIKVSSTLQRRGGRSSAKEKRG